MLAKLPHLSTPSNCFVNIRTWGNNEIEFSIKDCSFAASIFARNRQLQATSLARTVVNHIKDKKQIFTTERPLYKLLAIRQQLLSDLGFGTFDSEYDKKD